MTNKVVKLNQQECKELSAWLAEQTSVEIEPDYKDIIFRRGSAIELRMTLVAPQDSESKLKAVKEPVGA